MLATYRTVPSRTELLLALVACTIPVHLWAVLSFLSQVPPLLLRLTPWELVGAFGYLGTLALVESLLLWGGWVAVGLLAPIRATRDHLGAFCALGMLLLLLWAGAAHARWLPIHSVRGFAQLSALVLLPGVVAAGLALQHLAWLPSALRTLLVRAAPLAALYVGVDLIGLLVVVLRNV